MTIFFEEKFFQGCHGGRKVAGIYRSLASLYEKYLKDVPIFFLKLKRIILKNFTSKCFTCGTPRLQPP